MKSSIFQIDCGILYNKAYKMLDKWGSIADCILYGNSFFNPTYFTLNDNQRKMLYDQNQKHYIRVTESNLIYTHIIEKDFEKE
jgi:hypothetical protein